MSDKLITSLDELKALIIWAKEQKVQQLKIGNVEFLLSNYALIADIIEPKSQISTKPQDPDADPSAEPAKPPQEDPDLFWSAIP